MQHQAPFAPPARERCCRVAISCRRMGRCMNQQVNLVTLGVGDEEQGSMICRCIIRRNKHAADERLRKAANRANGA